MKGAKRFVRNRDILSARSRAPLTSTIKNILADLLESQNLKAENPTRVLSVHRAVLLLPVN